MCTVRQMIREEKVADNYTKIVLTVIAIFLGAIALGYTPTKTAYADNDKPIYTDAISLQLQGFGIVMARGGAVKRCVGIEDNLEKIRCTPWIDIESNTKLAE